MKNVSGIDESQSSIMLFFTKECVFFQSGCTTYVPAVCKELPFIHILANTYYCQILNLLSQVGENGISFYFAFLKLLIKFKIFPYVDWPYVFHLLNAYYVIMYWTRWVSWFL